MTLTTTALLLRRRQTVVLDHVTLAASPGQFVAVIGPNGAGKSTLLATLAGLLAPHAGLIEANARPLAAWPPRDWARHRAYLPQSPRCDWPLSVAHLVALGLTPELPAFGSLPATATIRIAATLAACDLATLAHRPLTELSGGERARAMLARALVGDPKLLILDEPFAGLDPAHALQTGHRLRTLAEGGRLVIAAMHDLNLAARYATHILALQSGRILAAGPTQTTLTAPLIHTLMGVTAILQSRPHGFSIDYS